MAVRRIGQILVDLGFITDEDLEKLLKEHQGSSTEMIGQVAIRLGLIGEDQLAQALAEQLGLQTISLAEYEPTPELLELISEPMAQLYRVLPVRIEEGVLTVAMCDPQNISVQDELRTFVGNEIRVMVATEQEVTMALAKHYEAGGDSLESLVADIEGDKDLEEMVATATEAGVIDLTSVEALAESAPVRKLLNMVLLLAIRDHASDLHFEPFETEFRIRIKTDGVLYEMVPPPRHLSFAITTRIKVMANLDIAERRLPQDGRIELNVGGHQVDLRVSVLPTLFGESVCMRILDRTAVSLDLNKIGMDEWTLPKFRTAITKPNGIVLVTGPTGCGKTTTLYAGLCELNTVDEKLITTEDPVEYDIDGLVQVPIDASIGNTFANVLRAILRQDPDRVLVGEIRDVETAEIAVQASLTGHMVFSTLHTNDAPSTVTRLRNMGVPPFLLAATVEAVLSQRLVRKICSSCREEWQLPNDIMADLELTEDDMEGKTFYRGVGCDQCNNTGYKGRSGLFEIMEVDDQLREMIINNASTDEMRDAAMSAGMVTLRDAGLRAAMEGITTAEEVIHETIIES